MIKTAWFRRYRSNETEAFDRVVQSWDTANQPSELADYSVCTTWGVKDKRYCLLSVLRKKLAYPDLKRAVIEQDSLFRPQTIVIEDRASGTQLIQDLIHERLSHVARYAPDGDKVMRLHAQTAVMENGFVWLPDDAPWARRLPRRAHRLSHGPPRRPGRTRPRSSWPGQGARAIVGGGLDRVYREPWGPRPEPTLRLLAPEGMSHVQIRPTNRSYLVRDRSVEAEQGDVPFLLRMGFRRDL